MKKIAVFTGAGISAESGIPTFRDCVDGLWYNFKIEEVATSEAWKNTPDKVLEFYNDRRNGLKTVEPNDAHKALAELEKDFEVTVITQNVDDLHERGGSSNVLHLHGELSKMRSVKDVFELYECTEDIKIGDKCANGGQLRPHLVLFGEYPYNVDEAYHAIRHCDYLLIIGTGFDISYTAELVSAVNREAKVIYIDPKPSPVLEFGGFEITYVNKKAVKGVTEVVKKIQNGKI
jgi:NAD-dependent deacetylase